MWLLVVIRWANGMDKKKNRNFVWRETNREKIENFCRDLGVSVRDSEQMGWCALLACILNGEQRVDEALKIMGCL